MLRTAGINPPASGCSGLGFGFGPWWSSHCPRQGGKPGEHSSPEDKGRIKRWFFDLDLQFLVLLVVFEYLELALPHGCSEMLAGITLGRGREWCNESFPPFQIPPEQTSAPLAPYKDPQRHLRLGSQPSFKDAESFPDDFSLPYFPFMSEAWLWSPCPGVIQPGNMGLTFNVFPSSFLSLARLDTGSPYVLLIFWLTNLAGPGESSLGISW